MIEMAGELIDGWTERDLIVKLLEQVSALKQAIDAQNTTLDGIDRRVTNLEQWRWKVVGWSAGAGAIAGVLIEVILRRI